MSAVEALAEVLREHAVGMAQMVDESPYDDVTYNVELRCPCGVKIKTASAATPNAWALARSHVTGALVAAIRSMPAELKADVVDGEVERRVIDWDDGIKDESVRVVTPWLPLGVSPETNGEQK